MSLYLGDKKMSIYVGDVLVSGSPGPEYGCVDLLVVGGGGAGGGAGNNTTGGGGGAGGFVEMFGHELTLGKDYNVSVGEGGSICPSTAGGDSCFGSTVVAYGGGGGNGWCFEGPVDGGSGGANSGKGVCGQGNDGGCSRNYSGGGGGGAGGAGGDGVFGSCPGNGGIGRCSCISGELRRYSGGGGGWGRYGSSCGGCGGGGDMDSRATYYGGGGGGGGNFGYEGCQGVVILRYKTDGSYGINYATGGCKYICGDYTIHCFTSDGTFCITH